jgi:DNA polymerase-3 subunit epsilon
MSDARPAPGADAYRALRPPPDRTPWRQARFCAVDLELSGLDPRRDEILSFGAIPIDEGRIVLGSATQGLVRPSGPISESSIRVHGLRVADLEHAPALDEAIDPLLAAMAGRIPVVHAAAVERSFLTPALRSQGLRLRRPMVDTAVLGLLWLHERDGRDRRHLTLAELAGELGLPSHRPHEAAGDALTTAQTFIALASLLDARSPESVRSLVRADRRVERIRAFQMP